MSVRLPPLAELFRSAPLYAILDTAARPDLAPRAILEALLRAGVQVVQYRHKGVFDKARYEECEALARRAEESGCCFFVNDRADVARSCRAAGVHFGQDDLPPERARLFIPTEMLVGFSTHTLAQAERATRLAIEYIAVGPVFPTSTKRNPDPVVGLDLVTRVRVLTDMPVVAIGGITLANARSVLDAGASAVAVIGDLLGARNIEARAREFLAALKSAGR